MLSQGLAIWLRLALKDDLCPSLLSGFLIVYFVCCVFCSAGDGWNPWLCIQELDALLLSHTPSSSVEDSQLCLTASSLYSRLQVSGVSFMARHCALTRCNSQ